MDKIDSELEKTLLDEGYRALGYIDGKLCGLLEFTYTIGLCVGLDNMGYERRYCYDKQEHMLDALHAITRWNGSKLHPPGPWIKCKGKINGELVDLLNEEWSKNEINS